MYTLDLDSMTLSDIIDQVDRWDAPAENLDEYQDVLSDLEVEVVA